MPFDCPASNTAPTWNVLDFAIWRVLPDAWGGGDRYLRQFRAAWIMHNRSSINESAREYQVPAELIAGICWNEVGGDPTEVDYFAYVGRTLDRTGPGFRDTWTITASPRRTSFGQVSMQLRTAAETLGLDPDTLSDRAFDALTECLSQNDYNIHLVARHVRQIIRHDRLQPCPPDLTMEEVRIIGARYQRGLSISMDQLKADMYYGERIVKGWTQLSGLLR